MEPWEVMISESQERMIAIVRPQMLEAVDAVLDRWELEHAVVGEVTDTGELRAFWGEDIVGEIPARLLTDECPRYQVGEARRAAPPQREIVGAPPAAEALLELLASPALRSRAFVFRRYDQLVGSRTVRRPGLDAAVLRLRPSMRGLAVSLDGQGRIARLDPFTGGALAVLEAARNVACVGGEPIGFTDCLNFGNPEKPEIGWELAQAIDGIAAACEALGVPIVSGNVSLYNETNGRAIHPTPVVGAVGLVEDVRRVPKGWREGDVIFAAFASAATLAGSEYQARFGEVGGTPPPLDLEAEARLVSLLWQAAPLATLVHDAAEGGLAVCLAEAALFSGCGAALDLRDDPVELFGEVGGRALVACSPESADEIETVARELSVPLRRVGEAGGGTLLGVELSRLREAWEGSDQGRPRICPQGTTADVWCLRNPFGGAGRLASRILRAVRAPAPRAGVGRDRRLGRRAADRAPRHGPRRAGLQRAAAPGAARRGRDRPHALLDDGREPVGERAAADPPRSRANGRARAQRQPRERRGAACGAARGRREARLGLRLRGDRRARRPRPGAACRRRWRTRWAGSKARTR